MLPGKRWRLIERPWKAYGIFLGSSDDLPFPESEVEYETDQLESEFE